VAPRLSVMRERVLHLSRGEAVREHRTPAFKLVIGVDADLTLSQDGRSGAVRAALVPPCSAHALTAHGWAVGIFMAAGSTFAPYRSHEGDVLTLHGRLCDALVSLARALIASDGRDDGAFVDQAFRLLRLQRVQRLDGRVAGSLQRLQHAPDRPLPELASAARLSPERLRHLVAEETGMPFSEHRLLQRTTLAMEHCLAGASIPAAARAAGFADHAHLTRTFARLFGRTPSSMPERSVMSSTWAERTDRAPQRALDDFRAWPSRR
jgi:AraC family transcriptional regulator